MGNKAGWIVAGALLVIVGGIVAYMIIAPMLDKEPSKPTSATTGVGALDFKDVEIPPTRIIGPIPTGAGNAADDYAKAVGVYKANKAALDALIEKLPKDVRLKDAPKLSEADAEILRQIDQHVSAGSVKARMDYVLKHGPRELKPGWHYQPAYDLVKLGRCLDLLAGDCIATKDYAQADKILQREMILGWHMMQERARTCMTWLGQDMQLLTIDRLRRDVYYPWGGEHLKQLDTTKEYFEKLDTFGLSFTTKMKILLVAKPQPGDVFNIAVNDKDRAWRVQGILTLGILKFVSKEEADRKHAQKLIDKYVASTDPLESAAAAGAQAFTRMQLQTYVTDDKAE